jgi:hypothetical protein
MSAAEITGATYLVIGASIAGVAIIGRSRRDRDSWLSAIADLVTLSLTALLMFLALWPAWFVIHLLTERQDSRRKPSDDFPHK